MRALIEYLGILAVIAGLTVVVPWVLQGPPELVPPTPMVTVQRDSHQPVRAYRGGELRVLFPLQGDEEWLAHESPLLPLRRVGRFALVRAAHPSKTVVTQEIIFETPREGSTVLVFRKLDPLVDHIAETWRLDVVVRPPSDEVSP
jgi:hypothetical protein